MSDLPESLQRWRAQANAGADTRSQAMQAALPRTLPNGPGGRAPYRQPARRVPNMPRRMQPNSNRNELPSPYGGADEAERVARTAAMQTPEMRAQTEQSYRNVPLQFAAEATTMPGWYRTGNALGNERYGDAAVEGGLSALGLLTMGVGPEIAGGARTGRGLFGAKPPRAPQIVEPPPAPIRPPPRQIGANGLPVRPPEPFRNSMRGGSEDLREAARPRTQQPRPDGGAAPSVRVPRRTYDVPHAPGYGTGTFEVLQNPSRTQIESFVARELRESPSAKQWARQAGNDDPLQYYPLRYMRDADGNVYVASGLDVEHSHMARGLRAQGVNLGEDSTRSSYGAGQMTRRDGQWSYNDKDGGPGPAVDYNYGRTSQQPAVGSAQQLPDWIVRNPTDQQLAQMQGDELKYVMDTDGNTYAFSAADGHHNQAMRALRDNGVQVRSLGEGAEITDPDAAGFIWRNKDGSFAHENANMVETGPFSAFQQRVAPARSSAAPGRSSTPFYDAFNNRTNMSIVPMLPKRPQQPVAAIRVGGRTYTGADHFEALDRVPQRLRGQAEASYAADGQGANPDVGFMIDGRFFPRAEAMQEFGRRVSANKPHYGYHATTADVQGNLRGGPGDLGPGVYHSPSPRIAEAMVGDEAGGFESGANVIRERLAPRGKYVPYAQAQRDLETLAQERGLDLNASPGSARELQRELQQRYQNAGFAGIYDAEYGGGLGQTVTWTARRAEGAPVQPRKNVPRGAAPGSQAYRAERNARIMTVLEEMQPVPNQQGVGRWTASVDNSLDAVAARLRAEGYPEVTKSVVAGIVSRTRARTAKAPQVARDEYADRAARLGITPERARSLSAQRHEPLASSVGGVPVPQVVQRDLRRVGEMATRGSGAAPRALPRQYAGFGGRAVAMGDFGKLPFHEGPRFLGQLPRRANNAPVDPKAVWAGAGLLSVPTGAATAGLVTQNAAESAATEHMAALNAQNRERLDSAQRAKWPTYQNPGKPAWEDRRLYTMPGGELDQPNPGYAINPATGRPLPAPKFRRNKNAPAFRGPGR